MSSAIARAGSHGLHAAGRLLIAFLMLGLVALAAIWFTLRSEAIELQTIARLVERTVNADQDDVRIGIGTAELRLAGPGELPALGFRDVEIRSPAGELLIAVPYLGVRADVFDLIAGRLRLTRLFIRGPSAQIVRDMDGGWRFGLGASAFGGGLMMSGPEGDAAQAEATGPAPDAGRGARAPAGGAEPSLAAVSEILEGLAGEIPPIPELEKLRSVTILDAALTYRNTGNGAILRSDDATFRLRRSDEGLTAAIGLKLDAGEGQEAVRAVRVALSRPSGTAGTLLDASLTAIRPSQIAGSVPELDWLALIDAPVDATLNGTLTDDGRLEALSGTLWAEKGRFVGADGKTLGPTDFDSLRLEIGYDVETERLSIDQMAVAGKAGRAELSGLVDLERDREGGLQGLVGQLAISEIRLDLPDLFATPIGFDSGELIGRVGFSPVAIDIPAARLSKDELTIEITGKLSRVAGVWESDIRAEGHNLSVARLKTHWPIPFAANARSWVVEHIESGMVDSVVAQARTGVGEPQISLDFRFSKVVSRYLDDMPPIQDGHGRGHLRLHEFMLELDRGRVEGAAGQPIALDGSSIRITDLWAPITPAEIRLQGDGDLGSILALIDRQPLGLVSKLGLELGSISGRAEVETLLGFPLLNDLLLEEVDADARARLHDVRMSLPIDGEAIDVSGDEIGLAASTSEMTIAGDMTVNGTAANVDWREIYGETPSRREILIRADVSPELLAQRDIDVPGFEGGTAAVVARISQSGAASPGFQLDADLTNARLAVPDLGWSKTAGEAGHARAKGEVADDGSVEISSLEIDAPGLKTSGNLAISATGELLRANLGRLRLGGLADISVEVSGLEGTGHALTIRGEHLDLGALQDILSASEAPGNGQDEARRGDLTVDFDIRRVTLTPRLEIAPARGAVTTADGGPIRVDLHGSINGAAPVRAEITLPDAGEGRLKLDSDDAGAFLRATGLAEAARDGSLQLSAALHDGGFDRMDGEIRMTDITLREAETFERILRAGRIEEEVTLQRGGLSFARVEIPFAYDNGTITLDTTVATGPALAVKLEGTIQEESGALDLSGVISPAYAVTGALNNIPLLGQILSGGEGEGIFAMTFSVGGTIDEPSYAVNPLSLLAPGFLRKIFTSKARKPDERFLEGLKRGE